MSLIWNRLLILGARAVRYFNKPAQKLAENVVFVVCTAVPGSRCEMTSLRQYEVRTFLSSSGAKSLTTCDIMSAQRHRDGLTSRCRTRTSVVMQAISVREYLKTNGFSEAFARGYLVPMTAALWSSTASDVMGHSALAMISFFHNHQMLQVTKRMRHALLSCHHRKCRSTLHFQYCLGGLRLYLRPVGLGARKPIKATNCQ